MAMTPSKKENCAAARGESPSASAAPTVASLREIPGRIAIAWAHPIKNAPYQEGSWLLPLSIVYRVLQTIVPVINKPKPATWGNSNCCSIQFFANNAIPIAGSVPTTSFPI